MRQIGARFLVLVLSFNLGQSESCGTVTILRRPLVHFGETSYPGQWPWQAALFHRINGSFFHFACGGVIVSSSYVITAAHCTFPKSKVRPLSISEILIRVGITNIEGGEHSLQQEKIARIDVHEEYITGSVESDIALLKLARELEITDFVSPICLWEGSGAEKLIVGKDGYVAGWGRDETDKFPGLLKHAVMPIVSRKICRDSDPKYYLRYLFDRKTFCAGYRNGTSASSGDSGGGLFIEVNGAWVLRGIVSNGRLTATLAVDTSNFIVFTDVAYYIDWIHTKMQLTIRNIKDDKYATCGNPPRRPSFIRNKYKQYRERPWIGQVRRVTPPYEPYRLCDAVIINELFVLAAVDKLPDRYLRNYAVLEVWFDLDDGEILSKHKVERILRHENYTRSARLNNIVLLELMDQLTFNTFLQPICLWSSDFVEDSNAIPKFKTKDAYRRIDCGPTIVGQNSHAYCYQHSLSIVNPPDFELVDLNGKMFLRGVLFDTSFTYEKYVDIWVFSNISHLADWIAMNAIKGASELFSLGDCPQQPTLVDIYRNDFSTEARRCYGAMITKTLLITIATCVVGVPLEYLKISYWMLQVRSIHIHPSFDSRLLTNNVAIAERTYYDDSFHPYCFPKHAEKLPSFQLNYFSTVVRISDTKRCAEGWRREEVQVQTDGSHFCGKFQYDPADQSKCVEDISGIPVHYEYPDRQGWYLRGILDIGKIDHCKENGLSEVFIDLLFYVDWIREVVTGYNTADPSRTLTIDT